MDEPRKSEKERAHVALSRSVDAVEIPAGTTVTLPAGTGVTITQTLGGNFTVAAGPYGMLYRIAARDADALGRQVPTEGQAPAPATTGAPLTDDQAVWKVLRTIFDPEIPVNVVDLGLVYGVKLEPQEGGSKVHIQMTLTAPGCGMAGVLKSDAETKVAALPGVKDVDLEIVWEPPWSRDRMSDAAKLQLGML